jgi:cobalamin biosynthesis Mg chelatase CobN
MVPDRTPSRVAFAALVMVALAGASGCAHRRAPDLRVSNPPNRSVEPGFERGRAVERRNGNGKSSAREEASAAALPAPPETAPPAHARSGATSFGTSVVITPRPAPADRDSSTRAAGSSRSSDADASGHPLLGTIFLVLLLGAAWAVGRAMLTRGVPG